MEFSPLLVPRGESIFDALMMVAGAALLLVILIVSYRRSRCLSRYPVWRSVLIAVLAVAFPAIWLISSFVNRDYLRRAWQRYNADHEARRLTPSQ